MAIRAPVTDALRGLLSAPAVPRAPGPRRSDALLVAAVLLGSTAEVLLRSDLGWPRVALVSAVLLALPLPWRRTHPFVVVVAVFGPLVVLSLVMIVADAPPSSLVSSIAVLTVPYALLRWGSGRELLPGAVVLLLAFSTGVAAEWTGPVDAAGALVFFCSPAVAGAAVRGWSAARAAELDQARLREREQLARELHDTVAHHVSAVVVRAQAGRAVAATRPDDALWALVSIEREASLALRDMRALVGSLRTDDGEVLLTPSSGVQDIPALAGSGGAGRPRVEVQLSGPTEGLDGPVATALFRLAQESITNALRHARAARLVTVDVIADERQVRMSVLDDGRGGGARQSGFGLIGMAERVSLLGGTLTAGPAPGGGWLVDAVLPRTAGR